ncbi:metallophosphoesterase [Deinococcus radiopugnans]|uniref:metallophosphoesterase n=1 Tax=Deinococcus radiopugnans TaxID=57497 RepID=UPI0036224D7C
MTRHTRALPGLTRPVRVALLTDLHYGLFIYGGSVRAWVDATNAARPELIVLGGDQMDYRADEPPTGLLTELKRLKAPLGVYGVWGNHDYGSFGKYYSPHYGPRRDDWPQVRESLRAAYAEAGVTILRNEGRRVREDLYLAGVDDLWEGEVDLGAALAGKPVQGATLLVSHNPDLLPDLPPAPAWCCAAIPTAARFGCPSSALRWCPADMGSATRWAGSRGRTARPPTSVGAWASAACRCATCASRKWPCSR